MKILSIYLENYLPLSLYSNILSIEIKVVNNLVIVLGTNGCGKTSLLKEINPLPPNPADYREVGKKTIVLEHKGSKYEIISIIKNGCKNTLIKDGVTIHSNVTTSVHREIITKEFNYTNLVHKILIGDLKFTQMDSPTKREILTSISSLNLDYIAKLHLLFKENLRESNAVLKHLNNKSTEVKSKLLTLDIPIDFDTIKEEKEQQFSKLIPFSVIKTKDINVLNQELDSYLTTLKNINAKANKISNVRVPDVSIKNADMLQDFINTCNAKISSLQLRVNDLVIELDDLTSVTNTLINNDLSIQEIENNIDILYKKIKNINPVLHITENHNILLNTLLSIVNEMDNIFIVGKDINIFSDEEIKNFLNLDKNYREKINSIKKYIKSGQDKIDHLSNSKHPVDCPKCLHRFGLSGNTVDSDLVKYKAYVDNANEELLNVEYLRALNDPNIADIELYESIKYRFLDIKRNYFMPSDFWLDIDIKTILQKPLTFNHHITKWEIAIRQNKEILDLTSELTTYENAISVFKKYGSNVSSKAHSIEESINSLLNEKKKYEGFLNQSLTVLKNNTTYSELNNLANKTITNINSNFTQQIDWIIQKDSKDKCNEIYEYLTNNKELLNKFNNLTLQSNEYSSEIEEYTKKIKLFSIIEKNLSPSTGIIADQMMGFITNFTQQMDNILSLVWEYNLNINPCNYTDGNLNYNFPLTVNDEVVKDISVGSKSIKAIIDLAFTVVVRQYLNLNDYPMFFDEPGDGFDKIHYDKLFEYIKSLLVNMQTNQMFIINHDFNFYSGLANKDTVVLDSRNIVVPDEYNENVNIVYL